MDYNNKSSDKKCMNKTKSCVNGPPRLGNKSDALKRKSFCVNDAVRSLDLALGKLKKSKLVKGDLGLSSQTTSNMSRLRAMEVFQDAPSRFNFNGSSENVSMMSANFSHYELMRNLSESNCVSEAAFSGTTSGRHRNLSDMAMKDEHLEKYFRSVEMWTNPKTDTPKLLPFITRGK